MRGESTIEAGRGLEVRRMWKAPGSEGILGERGGEARAEEVQGTRGATGVRKEKHTCARNMPPEVRSTAHGDLRGQCSTWGHAELCGQCLGVVRQEYGRGVGGSNLRFGRPEPAFGVGHSTTF